MAHTSVSTPVLHSLTCFLHTNWSKRCPCEPDLKLSRLDFSSAALRVGFNSTSHSLQDQRKFLRARVFCMSSGNSDQDYSYPKQDQAPPERTNVVTKFYTLSCFFLQCFCFRVLRKLFVIDFNVVFWSRSKSECPNTSTPR